MSEYSVVEETHAIQQVLDVRIHSITYSAEDVLLFDLRPERGESMPPFSPGAHIDIRMPNGLSRSYSLLNNSEERHRYVVGIRKDAKSRGGSVWMHDYARAGGLLTVSCPRNHFELFEEADHSIFIAGGIGITPLWSMIQRLSALKRSWFLYYGARSRGAAALLPEITSSGWMSHVCLSFDDETNGRFIDFDHIITSAPENTHFYCCGPEPMLQAYQRACAAIDPGRVHLEYFSPPESPALKGGYVVRLARSGVCVEVQEGRSILESLESAGVSVPSSCQQGICGVCETRIISGTPDHRDLVLTEEERASGETMMICCSGSLGSELVLDL
ncbi:PDR/VanB family oxidoreductase [Neopusillimonas maritima]|jgi:vanillate O-demethylase ferredoxin subunit|uniref:Oxidoreductase n=1 Tax=Neopusillimonas maritima TaxID=2026239 RepID=A0ABX9MWM5_9BURK|nr:PDR/VanB family oxidoreductase [Neopusillimonas maritima]RII83238.1 oxidoreductase [Neopusillimonas maritima]